MSISMSMFVSVSVSVSVAYLKQTQTKTGLVFRKDLAAVNTRSTHDSMKENKTNN